MPHTISEVMRRHTVTVGPDVTILEVKLLFESSRFHHVLVVEQGRLAGVVSDRDLLKHISPFIGKLSERVQDRHTLNLRVHQVMTRRLVTASAGETLEDAARRMLEHDVSCLPVVDAHGRVQGILTWKDLVRWLVGQWAGGDP